MKQIKHGEVMSGSEFNALMKDRRLVKTTSADEQHHGVKFVTGLNVDPVPFFPHGNCSAGGIYFCEETDMKYWCYYSNRLMVHVRDVNVPDDAQVYVESMDGQFRQFKYKADKIVLGTPRLIADCFSHDMDSLKIYFNYYEHSRQYEKEDVMSHVALWDAYWFYPFNEEYEKQSNMRIRTDPRKRTLDVLMEYIVNKERHHMIMGMPLSFLDMEEVQQALITHRVSPVHIPCDKQNPLYWKAVIEDDSFWYDPRNLCMLESNCRRILPLHNAVAIVQHDRMKMSDIPYWRSDNTKMKLLCDTLFKMDERMILKFPASFRHFYLTPAFRKTCEAEGWVDVLELYQQKASDSPKVSIRKRKRRDWSKRK